MASNKDYDVTAQEVTPAQSEANGNHHGVSEVPATSAENNETTRGSRYQYGRTLFGYVKTKQFWLVLLFG
jgi:hypothetical protein